MNTDAQSTEQIQPEVLARLAAQARERGETVNEFLRHIPDEMEAVAAEKDDRPFYEAATPEEWSRELRAWAASHPVSAVIADDSRESIYEGRGE
jgi:hypothetical protein